MEQQIEILIVIDFKNISSSMRINYLFYLLLRYETNNWSRDR